MIAATVWFVLGLVLLALGGDSIVRAASGLAQRFGASPFVAGLLLVAFGPQTLALAGRAATPEQAQQVCKALRGVVADVLGELLAVRKHAGLMPPGPVQ